MSWLEASLVDLANFRRGHDLSRGKMKEGEFIVAASNGAIGNHNEYTTKGPGLTIGRSGNIGNPYFYQKDFWAHNTVLYVDDFKDNWPKYVYYFLKTIDFKQFNTGSAVPTLNRNHIHSIKINIPPLQEQKAIAEVLSSLDDKIELLQKQNETLEALAQTLFRQWFIEEADDSWEEVELQSLGSIVCGKTPSKKNKEYYGVDVPFVKIPDMHRFTYVLDSSEYLSKEGSDSQSNKLIPPNSVLVSCIATVGVVSMNHTPCHTNQQINTIIPKSEAWTIYIYLLMKSLKPVLIQYASGGTATMNLNTGQFSKLQVLSPPEEILNKFNTISGPLFQKIKQNLLSIRTLAQTRDTLLPKLMSGQVRVKLD